MVKALDPGDYTYHLYKDSHSKVPLAPGFMVLVTNNAAHVMPNGNDNASRAKFCVLRVSTESAYYTLFLIPGFS